MSSSTFFGQLWRAIFPGNLLPDLRRYSPMRYTKQDRGTFIIFARFYNHIRSSYAMTKYHIDHQEDHNESDTDSETSSYQMI